MLRSMSIPEGNSSQTGTSAALTYPNPELCLPLIFVLSWSGKKRCDVIVPGGSLYGNGLCRGFGLRFDFFFYEHLIDSWRW
jgi:hypothetical protein